MRKKYLYRVGLAILPVWMGRYIELVGEKSTDSVVNILINGIFGRDNQVIREVVLSLRLVKQFSSIVFDFIWRLYCSETTGWSSLLFLKNFKSKKMDWQGICLATFVQYALYRLFCGNAHAVFVYGMQ